MSFGVGIGDVLLITKLGFTLWVNISGAKEEREELMTNLMDWKEKIESIEPMLTDHAGMTPHDLIIAKKKFSEAIATLQVLEELNRKLVKGRIFRRLAWEARGRETFLEYQAKLEKKLDEIEKLFDCASMMVLKNEVRGNSRLLEGLSEFSNQRTIRFIDALDVKRLIPLDLCQQWEDFRTILPMFFRDSAGKSFVEKGEYDIMNEENGALLRPENWSYTVRAGMTFSMAIVLRKTIVKGENDYRCPACKTRYIRPGDTATGHGLERVQCVDKYCRRWFQITTQTTVVEVTPFSPELPNDLGSNTSEYSNEDALVHIQRFHIRVDEIEELSW
ncbi:hypothetical protein DFP73DRAFT_570522 [Morchella snyderi]|nr:hypothetical protein DFP73DRAFT_570522 [Morchella snyderi]